MTDSWLCAFRTLGWRRRVTGTKISGKSKAAAAGRSIIIPLNEVKFRRGSSSEDEEKSRQSFNP